MGGCVHGVVESKHQHVTAVNMITVRHGYLKRDGVMGLMCLTYDVLKNGMSMITITTIYWRG